MAEPSTNALALLALLHSHGATAPARALTDQQLSLLLGLSERSIVDLAGELLHAGHPIAAECVAKAGRKPGRYIASAPDMARYVASLRGRALLIFRRYSAAKRAHRQLDSAASPDSAGQFALFSTREPAP